MVAQNIVLIHGWACDESIWQDTRNYLEQKHCVFTLNLPSMKNLYSYRDAVVELIEQNWPAGVILMGWSMGSLVAIQAAHHLQHKVQGLALVSGTSKFLADRQPGSKFSGRYQGGVPSILATRMKKRLSKNREQTLADFYKLMFSSQEQAQGLADQIIAGYLKRGRVWEISEAQAGLDFLMAADVRAELHAITCPTLLLHGQEDNICPLEGARFMQEQMACARLINYPGVGHIPFLTNFRDFHHALEEWLSVYDS